LSNKVKTAYLVLGQTIITLITFVLAPYLSRKLSLHEYGTFVQVVMIYDFMSVLIALGLTQILYVFFEKYLQDIGSLLVTFIFIQITAACIGSVILYGFSFYAGGLFGEPLLNEYIRLYLPNIFFGNLINLFGLALVYFNRHRPYVATIIISNLLKLIIVLLLDRGGMLSIKNILLAYMTMNFLCLISLFFFIPLHLPRFSFSFAKAKDIVKRSLPLWVTAILGSSYTYIAGMLISTYLSSSQFAIYRNGSFEIPLLGSLYISVSMVFLPQINRMALQNELDKVVAIKRRIIGNTISLTYPIIFFFLFFHYEFITLYLSDKYAASATIFLIINILLLLRFQDYNDVLIAFNKGFYVMMANIVFFISNATLNIILIHFYGYIGSAIATAGSALILSILLIRKTLKVLHASVIDFFDVKLFVKVILSVILILLLMKFIFSIWLISKLMLFLVILPLYILIVYTFFLKFKIVSIEYFENYIKAIPIIGRALSTFAKKIIG